MFVDARHRAGHDEGWGSGDGTFSTNQTISPLRLASVVP